MKIPKLQTAWTTIPSDVTSSNWSVRLAQQQAALQRQRRFAQALARQRHEDRRREDARRNQATVTADNRTTAKRRQDRQQQQRSDPNNQVNRALSWYGLSNGLGQTSNILDAGRATPGFGSFIGDQNIQTFAAGADPFNLAPYYTAAARFGSGTLRNWGLTNTLRSQLKNEIRVASELGKPLAAPTVAQPLIKAGDVEINNPQLAYRQIESGGGQNFLETGYAFTPLQTKNMLNYEKGTFKPTMLQKLGIEPGWTTMRPMYSQGSLWFGTDYGGDLITTAKTLRLGNSKGGITNSYNKAGNRRVSDYKGEVTPENSQVFTWQPNYGYKRIGVERPSTLTWGKARTIVYNNNTGSPYENLLGKGKRFGWNNWDRYVEGIKGKRFGKYQGAGTEQIVYDDLSNSNQILKIQTDMGVQTPEAARNFPLMNLRLSSRNQVPYQQQSKLEGFIQIGNKYYPVIKQKKLTPLTNMSDVIFTKSIKPKIHHSLSEKGFYLNQDGRYTNGKVILEDLKPANMGFDENGNLRFFDVQAFQD